MERNKIAAKLIKGILKDSPDTHNEYTPLELCDKMITKLPVLNTDMIILVMFNLEFIWIIKEKIKDLKNVWFLTPDQLKKKTAIGMGINENNIFMYEYNNKIIIGEEKMPKFDVVVGNPPYKGSLHFKFLNIANSVVKDSGKIVWLQPARWLQDPFAPYKKNSDYNKNKDLPFVDFVLLENANLIFNIDAPVQLMISILDKTKSSILVDGFVLNNPFMKKSIYQKNIFDKIRLKMKKTLKDVIIYGNAPKEYAVMLSILGSGHGLPSKGYLPGKKWEGIFENGMLNGKKIDQIKTKMKHVKNYNNAFFVPFKTKIEAQNFIKSSNTTFIKFWMMLITLNVHIPFNYIPFMDNYSIEWTNEKYYEYFNLTEEEINYIESQIK